MDLIEIMTNLNKILVQIQGRTLILFYKVNRLRPEIPAYIEVLPSPELGFFNLKGLSPEMFCINLADMVNIHGKYAGTIENEKQVPVAKWAVNYDEIRQALREPHIPALTMSVAVNRLKSIPGLVNQEKEYFDYQDFITWQDQTEPGLQAGYRLTIVLEEIECHPEIYGYYFLGMHDGHTWANEIPPLSSRPALHEMIANKMDEIRHCGLSISTIRDETAYHHE